MTKITIRTIKQALDTAFPAVEFTYGVAGRGVHGHAVSWTGGPTENAVREAALAACLWRNPLQHFCRHMTAEEWAVYEAEMDARDAERRAAEPARRAAAKQAGIDKRRATVAFKQARAAQLTEAFPGVAFALGTGRSAHQVSWLDGPAETVVCELLGVPQWHCTRTVSVECIRRDAEDAHQVMQERRTRRRLAQSHNRTLRVAKGVARRARLRAKARRQLSLPLLLIKRRKPSTLITFQEVA